LKNTENVGKPEDIVITTKELLDDDVPARDVCKQLVVVEKVDACQQTDEPEMCRQQGQSTLLASELLEEDDKKIEQDTVSDK